MRVCVKNTPNMYDLLIVHCNCKHVWLQVKWSCRSQQLPSSNRHFIDYPHTFQESSLVSSLGGALSLYLGIAIIMCVELLELIFDLILNVWRHLAKGWAENANELLRILMILQYLSYLILFKLSWFKIKFRRGLGRTTKIFWASRRSHLCSFATQWKQTNKTSLWLFHKRWGKGESEVVDKASYLS